MGSHAMDRGSLIARIRLDSSWLSRIAGRSPWLAIHEHGLAIESAAATEFVPWRDVQSLRAGRADDAFVVVHSGGQRVVVPEATTQGQADALADAIVARAHLAWMHNRGPHMPPIAIRPEAVAAYEQAFRTWSRVD